MINPMHQAQVKLVYHECLGGETKPGQLAAKVGPLGFSPKLVADDIARQTADEWNGLPITVKIQSQNGKLRLEIMPSAKTLIIRNLEENQGTDASGNPRKHHAYFDEDEELRHDGNITMDKIIDIARELRPRSTQRKLDGVVVDVLKACNSLGCEVENQHPEDIMDQVHAKEIQIPQD